MKRDRKQYMKEYYQRNKERIRKKEEERGKKEYMKDYREKNRERLCKRKRELYAQNREERLKDNKEYYEQNKGKVVTRATRYHARRRKTDEAFRKRDNLRNSSRKLGKVPEGYERHHFEPYKIRNFAIIPRWMHKIEHANGWKDYFESEGLL